MDNKKIWDCGSPLYDSYEVVAVSNIIERHLMVMTFPSNDLFIIGESKSMRLTNNHPILMSSSLSSTSSSSEDNKPITEDEEDAAGLKQLSSGSLQIIGFFKKKMSKMMKCLKKGSKNGCPTSGISWLKKK